MVFQKKYNNFAARNNGEKERWISDNKTNIFVNKSVGRMTPNNTIHIGKIIKEKLAQKERSHAWLARKLFMDPSNVSKLLQHSYINTDLLWRISFILHENLFNYYSILYEQYNNTDKHY